MRSSALFALVGLVALVAAEPHGVHVTLQKRYTADGRDLMHAHAARNAHFAHRKHHARALARRNESDDCEDESTTTQSTKVSTQASDDDEDCEDETETSKTRQASTTTDDDDCEDEESSDTSTSADDDCEDDDGSTSSSAAKPTATKAAKAQVKVKTSNKSSGSSSKSSDSSSGDSSKSSDSSSGDSSKSSGSSSGGSSSSGSTSSFPGGSSGTVTFYTQDGTVGACGLDNNKVQPDSAVLAALCPSLFQSMCGKTFKITDKTTGKSINVLANDECPSCACDHVDLSLGAFDGLGQSRDLGVLNVNFG